MPTPHTPGPWELCRHLESMAADADCSCGYRGVIYGPEHNVPMAICQPGHDGEPVGEEGLAPMRYPREVELANMRLIAAAPELLAACKLFAAYDAGDMDDGTAMMIAYAQAREAMIAALTKAQTN